MSKVWLDGELVDRDAARVSVFDHGLLYGDGVFEGIRAYGGRIFKMAAHLDRLWSSAERIRLEIPYSRDELEGAMRSTLEANGVRDGYIRLVVTRGVGGLGLHPFRCPRPGVFCIADRIELYPAELYEQGMAVIVARRPRIPRASLDPAIKSLNYLNNILAKIEAIDAGVLEAIMLNPAGEVAECTGDNVFAIRGGELHTPSAEAGILRGITRGFVIERLAPDLGLPVVERTMALEDLLSADEVFLTGTAAEIIGVSRIDEHTIGDGRVGPVTKSLVERFGAIVTSDAPED